MRQMKDSGVEWIGQIPEDWRIERLQWYLDEVKVSNSPLQTSSRRRLKENENEWLFEG